LLDEMRETLAGIPKQVQASVERPILPSFPFFTHWDEFVATKKSDRKWKRDTADGAEANRAHPSWAIRPNWVAALSLVRRPN
jgi:hypothetical protein